MIKPTLAIASLAGALGLGLAAASPAEATGPWGIAANGTQLNGIALQGVALDSIRMQEPEEDHLGSTSCEEWICGLNGTQLNGIALQGVTFDSIRMQDAEEDDADALGIGTGCQDGPCPRNGAQLNGIALEGVTLDSIRMQEPEEDDADALGIGGTCEDGPCPRNGTQLNGIALPGVMLDSIRLQETAEDDADAIGGSCEDGPCPRNGPQLNGIALEGFRLDSIRLKETGEDDPNCPDWMCGANGTQLNGLALQRVTPDSIRMQETEEDDADALGGGRQDDFCPTNGRHLNGLALEDVTLDSIRMQELEGGDADAPDFKEPRPPVVPPLPVNPSPSVRDMLLQIQASPGGSQLLKEAEIRSAPIQRAMANFSTACEPPACLEATPYKPGSGSWGNYGFQIWGQNITWLEPRLASSFWLTAPGATEQPRFKQGIPLLVAQHYDNISGGWHVVTFELCKQNHDGRFYEGPVLGRLFQGLTNHFPNRKLPSDATLINTWQLTIGPTPLVSCHMFPTLVELTRAKEQAFVFELEVGDLLVQRVTLRKL